MRINCPHCRNPLEIVDHASWNDVVCPSCGSSMNLVNCDTLTFDAAPRERIRQYQLLDCLGHGAHGSVWRARDTNLDRDVAVKIPRREQLDSSTIERFVREAQAAAQLKHPNIVAVHDVGQDGDRVYIVSDLVEGMTLADWLTAHRASAEEAASCCLKIARALEHAHQEGVIHRDLKPSNVMLGARQEPYLMDFGLAKREAAEITMTLEGRVLGTPAYMSPEQARGSGHAADRRCDIYSLGVILFELLTGERPFRGNTRMLLHQVMHDEPPSPRSLNGSIARDLETICLKCLQKDPNDRYQDAPSLAEDLQRFLDGRPIVARPVGRLVRGWRWCCRNPMLAAASAAAIACLLLALVATTVGYVSTRGALSEARQSRQHAVDERNRANLAFQQARQAVDDYFLQISENRLLNVPGMQPLRKELLESALAYYQQFLEQHGDDPELDASLALAAFHVGRITSEIGSIAEARTAYEQSLPRLNQLVQKHPQDRRFLDLLGQTQQQLGSLHYRAGQLAEAEQLYVRAGTILADLVARHPDDLELANTLASNHSDRGLLSMEQKRTDLALEHLHRALALREQLMASSPDRTLFQQQTAQVHNNLGLLHKQLEQPAESLRAFQNAVAIQERLLEKRPDWNELQSELASSYNNIAWAHLKLGNYQEVMDHSQRAGEIYQQLVDQNPDVLLYAIHLGACYSNNAKLFRAGVSEEAAMHLYDASVDTLTAVLHRDPDNQQARTNLITALLERADLFDSMQQPDRAITDRTAADRLQAELTNEVGR